jgi:hypothetical protein
VLLVTAPGPHSVTVRLWGGPAIRVQDNMNRTGGSQAGLPAGREQDRGEDTIRTDASIHWLVAGGAPSFMAHCPRFNGHRRACAWPFRPGFATPSPVNLRKLARPQRLSVTEPRIHKSSYTVTLPEVTREKGSRPPKR